MTEASKGRAEEAAFCFADAFLMGLKRIRKKGKKRLRARKRDCESIQQSVSRIFVVRPDDFGFSDGRM